MRVTLKPAAVIFICGVLSIAQQSSKPKVALNASASLNCGPVENSRLKCPRFGLTYQVPFGWVDRTDEMQVDSDEGPNSTSGKSQTLLAIFERPPAAPGETINSAVVIAAESLADYPGIKQAADYFGPISDLAEQNGFKVVNQPYAFPIGTRQLVRGDFSRERDKITMWQSSLVLIENGSILSFMVVAGSEDELDELIGRLSFAAKTHSHK